MEKSSQSSADSSNSRGQTDHLLKQLNKGSLKISKPQYHHHPLNHQRQPSLNNNINTTNTNTNNNSSSNNSSSSNQQQQQQQQQTQQPPVYNINKNDFRDVVQKLTGSPAHDRLSTPPPIQAPKPQSSRLHRFRPPPLAHVSPRPPPQTTLPPPPPPDPYAFRPRSPFSPLPPFPAVSAAAESPISAYMRYLQASISSSSAAAPAALSPQWIPNLPPLPSRPPATSTHFALPPSPAAFGIPSPRLQYPLLSPNLLFSPTPQLGFPPLPVSPRLPVPSPGWKDL